MDNIYKLHEIGRTMQGIKPIKKHDRFAFEVIDEAIKAANNGNFGVGAILVDKKTFNIEYRGQNKVFSHHRSDLHAEMDVLTKFEEDNKGKSRELLKHFMLLSSIESCPMCICRMITAGVNEAYHIANDAPSGMVQTFYNLPPVWHEIAQGHIYQQADCSPELSVLAKEVFSLSK